ncbi:biotin/lipoyl-containing protein [Georgenia ruanii]|uniref:Biotin attachment protein n=1 Tax=Georgenia ruanii TaxID=348442 RepID=A0A7J9V1F1_9MICO|nr:lipoyl domain-containing protein [Georgenia ruanii]MPV90512.1 biotin attachment protein [Georgenia ruanii]
MTEVPFPPLDETHPDTEGVLVTWYVADGETVATGQLLADVQVEKVDAEVTAPTGGTIRLLAGEGSELRQGALIARIE